MRVTRSFIPNLFTIANLYCGFVAIVLCAKDDYINAGIFLLLAGFFDMFDGIVARLTKSTSEFGVELDSLCDAVSFGVAPSFMLYQVHFKSMGDFGILLSSLPAIAGVLRLARFNIQLTSFEDKLYFRGMPIPSGALFIVSYILFFHITERVALEHKTLGLVLVTLVASLLMISKIKFDNLPRPSLRSFRQRPFIVSATLVGMVACILSKGLLVFPVMVLYGLYGTIRATINLWKERQAEDDDNDEDEMIEEQEQSPFDI